jgi:two-component system cell cycle sensor histidine kinase/response regulator CckA
MPRPDKEPVRAGELPGPGADDAADLILCRLSDVLSDDTLETAMSSGLALLAETAGAASGALILVQNDAVTSSAWSGDEILKKDFSAQLEQLAREGVRHQNVPFDPSPIPIAPGLLLRVFPFSAGLRALGAFGLAWRPGSTPSNAVLARVEEMARLLASKTALHLDVSAAKRTQAQYERWFKRLDDQLRVLDRERQKFASMVNQTDTEVFVADINGRTSWLNKALAGRFSSGEGVGVPCRDVCTRVCGSACNSGEGPCPVERAMITNAAVHQERQTTSGGVTRNLYWTALPIKGPDGRPYEMIVTIQDLTDLEVLRRSEARYRTLFDQSSNAILMIEPATRAIVLANAMAVRMLGYSADEFLKLSLPELHRPGDWERLSPDYERLLAGKAARIDCCLVTCDGRLRIADVCATRFENGGRELVMMEFRDLTETRNAEEALRQAEERLRTVVNKSPLVLFALDREGRFILSEGKGLERLNLKPGEVVGQSAYKFYAEAPLVLDCLRRAFEGEEFSELVHIGRLAFETWYSPTRDEAGQVSGVIGVATDVTSSKRLEEQLRQAQKMEAVGRLAGGVAHDFNNLLTVILGHCEFMMNRIEPGTPLHRDADAVHKAGIRGSLLARQLLAFSRKEVLEPQVLDVNTILIDLHGMLRRLIGEDIDLITAGHPTPARVKADQGQLEQVIMNLVVNARDAMPQGGKLTVEVGPIELDEAYARDHIALKPGSYVMLAVSDTGFGMTAETRTHIFEPFFTTKEQGKGTGLGLSMVYGIVRQNGGDVQVYTELGNGTTVKVYLPCVEEEVSAEDLGLAEPQTTTNGCEVVLLTEDEDEVRSLARDILEMNGYSVLEAACGEEALRIARSHPGAIHLLLTDVVMPGMSGGELAHRLAGIRKDLKVLFMSGYPDDAIVRHGVLGAEAHFIQKPFTLDALARKVRDVIDSESSKAA